MNSNRCQLFFYLILFSGYFCCGQVCPKIESPLNGDIDVPVDTQVSWNVVGGIDGYSVSLGTTEGGSDILNSRSAALVNFLNPVVGFPDNTEIFVTISLFLDDGSFITCASEKFTTVDVTTPPNCTSLSKPLPESENVNSGEDITWEYAATATGYWLSIGLSAMGNEILAETDVGNVLSYSLTENLPLNTEVFVTVTPYNENGEASGCTFQTFTTGASNINCEQFRPEINMPATIGLCGNNQDVIIASDDIAQGIRWFKIEEGNEILLSEQETVTISEVGNYRYDAYNVITLFGETGECTSSQVFSVVNSETAIVEDVRPQRGSSGVDLEVFVSGAGDYKFALDDREGPYSDSPIFISVAEGGHIIFIRDKNGCGITEYVYNQGVNNDDFPEFFTPNNDGINDFWQIEPSNSDIASLKTIFVFDRYGNLLAQLGPQSRGWDGTFGGRPMPSSTYWYTATSIYDTTVQGFFALKR